MTSLTAPDSPCIYSFKRCCYIIVLRIAMENSSIVEKGLYCVDNIIFISVLHQMLKLLQKSTYFLSHLV